MFVVISGRSFAHDSGVRAAGYRPCQCTNGSFSRGMEGMAREIAGVSLSTREKIWILPQLTIWQYLYWGYCIVPGKCECLFI